MTPVMFFGVLCVGTIAQFTSIGQNTVLYAHNKLRSEIAQGVYYAKGTVKPPASNMLKMKWDPTLAASAQAHANKCPNGFSEAAGLGENLHTFWTSENVTNFDVEGATISGAWEKEFHDFGWQTNVLNMDHYNSGIGHATQMAWAKTNRLGCGVKNCGIDCSGSYKVVAVCQYSPKGNNFGQNIYTTGATCSACPSGTTCERDTGLCV